MKTLPRLAAALSAVLLLGVGHADAANKLSLLHLNRGARAEKKTLNPYVRFNNHFQRTREVGVAAYHGKSGGIVLSTFSEMEPKGPHESVDHVKVAADGKMSKLPLIDVYSTFGKANNVARPSVIAQPLKSGGWLVTSRATRQVFHVTSTAKIRMIQSQALLDGLANGLK